MVVTARENLTIAFEGCHRSSIKNKTLILKKLIPLNMLHVNNILTAFIYYNILQINFYFFVLGNNAIKRSSQ